MRLDLISQIGGTRLLFSGSRKFGKNPGNKRDETGLLNTTREILKQYRILRLFLKNIYKQYHSGLFLVGTVNITNFGTNSVPLLEKLVTYIFRPTAYFCITPPTFYSELRDQVIAPPKYSLFWLQTFFFVLTQSFHLVISLSSFGALFLVLRRTQYLC